MLFLRDTCVGCVSSVSLASLAGVNARIDVYVLLVNGSSNEKKAFRYVQWERETSPPSRPALTKKVDEGRKRRD